MLMLSISPYLLPIFILLVHLKSLNQEIVTLCFLKAGSFCPAVHIPMQTYTARQARHE